MAMGDIISIDLLVHNTHTQHEALWHSGLMLCWHHITHLEVYNYYFLNTLPSYHRGSHLSL